MVNNITSVNTLETFCIPYENADYDRFLIPSGM
jgi:hypothetical protein